MHMGNDYATKQDLRELEQRLLGAMKDSEARLQEFVRDSQTEVLRGIEAYVRSSEARLRRLESGLLNLHADDDSMNQRLAAVESRLLEVEKKLLGK
jgi:hypothetical protein